jgi:serine-type D-Ala-D-Ala carboxypeptidase
VASTEYMTDRGLIHGTVHDPKAFDLNGVAGHAGLFSTAEDLAVLSQALLNGGRYDGVAILEAETIERMMANQFTTETDIGQSLGWNLYRGWFMDGLSSPVTAGHTGFTGTSFHINPVQNPIVILFTNRVHPTRDGPSINPVRQKVSHLTARDVPVRPAVGRTAWFSENGADVQHTLALPVTLNEPATLSFRTMIDIASDIPRDNGYVEISTDDGKTWSALTGTLRHRFNTVPTDGHLLGSTNWQWVKAEFDLSAYRGDVLLRFRYETNQAVNGRGWYVDQVRVQGDSGPIFKEGKQHMDQWQADGWVRSTN